MFTTNDELNGLPLTRLCSNIIGTNLLTKFHEDRKINVASRVLTRKNAPTLAAISEINVASRVKNVPAHGNSPASWQPCFSSKFHEDRKINVASRVLTRKKAPPLVAISDINVASRLKTAPPLVSHVFQANFMRVLTRKYAPAPGGHVFQPTGIIFKLVQDIIGMNLLTKFHEDWSINMAPKVTNCPAPSHPYIIETNLLTKFHEDWIINVACRELTRLMFTAHDTRWTKCDHKSSP
ncbi:hypothetical protein DPMN_032302 [Dreissena polymorpha]|uniref:Uncharacterized protein n=1 Tax=Dreissena polymorpha TaxID=45954 RepID=A0A9D4M4R1_DREPO|nr:hypothetical protein DPMN_032302 [Dreissena polymorpha]